MIALLLVLQGLTAYDSTYDQIKNLTPRADKAAAVHGLVVRRDVMELRLDSGTVYLLSPVANRTIGLAFVGAGSVSFTPPLSVERFNLRREMNDTAITGPISAAVLVFADSTEAQITRGRQFQPSTSAADAQDAVHDALGFLIDDHARFADGSLMTALLNGQKTDYFTAYVQRTHGENVMVQLDPLQAEEVLLLRRGHQPGQRVETVCQFQRAADLAANVSIDSERPQPLQIDAYDIDATIDGNYKFAARTTARFVGRAGHEAQRWVQLLLYPELDVDSVTTPAGAPLAFYRKDATATLSVRFATPLAAGDTQSVRVVYHGGLIGFGSAIEQMLPPWWDPVRRDMPPVLDSWAFIKDTELWYPRYDFEPASISLTYHTPKDYKLASIGRLLDSKTEGNVVTTHWKSALPTTQVSFNIGPFDEFEIKDPRIPPVVVDINREAHSYINHYIPQPRNPQDWVGSDITNSLSFFSKVYGPPLFEKYYATEIPYFHGQAFPGMIHLSFATFMSVSTSGFDQTFRAHEMAHQWWGIGVEPASYRDVWMSEGFAEFSGLWYMQSILQDNDKYFKQLRDSREEIRRERDHAVPIALGGRAFESRNGNYDLIMYEKGAWVLHMLRNMLLDRRTMSEQRFQDLMHAFYATYRGRRASTQDFERVVEQQVGQPMGWFFDEWVNGTAIPTYTFSWNAEPSGNGQYVAHLRVRQSDVPESFTMPVPVLIKFSDGEALVRMTVKGSLSEAQFTLPAQPVSIQLNPLESVLAEVKTEPWQ